MRLLRLASVLSFVSLAFAWRTYTVPYSGGNDDAPALNAVFKSNPELATDATILFKKGVTYNLNTPVNFPRFTNVVISVQGNISYAANIAKTQEIVRNPQQSGYKSGWLFFNGGNNVTLEGSQDSSWGWMDSHGQQWWDAMQVSAKQVDRPTAVGFLGMTGGVVKYMKMWQPVAWAFNINASDTHIHHNTIMAVSNNPKITPYNTDGFNVNGFRTTLEDNVIHNSDDCIVVCNPAGDITVRRNRCVGSNGLSITGSSLNDKPVDIKNVLFENCTIENALWGARFGSWRGSGGTVRNITWKDIAMNNVKIPIFITQKFPYASSGNEITNIKDFAYGNIHGTLKDSPTVHDVINFELAAKTVSGIRVKDIDVKTLSGQATTVVCDPTMIQDPNQMGFKCVNGPFTPT